jgi:hypothetical protein
VGGLEILLLLPEGLREKQVHLAEPLRVCLTWVNTNRSAQINQGGVAVILRQASLVRCSGAAGKDPSTSNTATTSAEPTAVVLKHVQATFGTGATNLLLLSLKLHK